MDRKGYHSPDAMLREDALRMACDTKTEMDNADSIVDRAQAFYEFLKGDDDVAEGKKK